ncbi:MAG: DMT family transporter [Actinocatenispora sp.]
MSLSSVPAGHPAARVPRNSAPVRFLVLALIWGMSFLLIKIADEQLAALHVAAGRVLFGAATLLVILVVRRDALPRGRRTWAHLAVVGLFANVVPFTLYAYAERLVPSALAGICNATTPLFTVLIALLALPQERPDRRRVSGLVVGFLGVLVVLGVWQGLAAHSLAGAGMALGAAACYGIAFGYIRRYLTGTTHSNIALSAGQLVAASVELVAVTPLLAGVPHHLRPGPVLALAALGVFGTGLAYVLQYGLVRDIGATTTSTVTYLIPVVATAAGLLLLHENLTWNEPVGALVVLAGAALSQWRPRRRFSPGRGRGATSRRGPSPVRCTEPVRSGPPRR